MTVSHVFNGPPIDCRSSVVSAFEAADPLLPAALDGMLQDSSLFFPIQKCGLFFSIHIIQVSFDIYCLPFKYIGLASHFRCPGDLPGCFLPASEGYYKGLTIEPSEIDSADCGLRPCSPDGLPYIGRTTTYKNLTIASGHAMMGWSLGPSTGKLVSEIISDKKPSLDLSPFHPERKF